jgi:uncharacterized protein (TIGR00661 family)
MKRILYAIQATGNGHLNRAMTIIPVLKKRADVDILISGNQAELELPFEVTYRLRGMTYYYNSTGGINYINSFLRLNFFKFIKDIFTLPIEDYDLVISDFEPISVWSSKLKGIPNATLCNQTVIMEKAVSRPKTFNLLAKFILKYLVPANHKFGYHYIKFRKNIFTPIIRKEIREAEISDIGHYTIYLPSYSDENLINFFKRFSDTKWQVFSKNCQKEYQFSNITILPVNKEKFTQSIVSCRGIICNSGFETTAEALYLGKKLLVIPQKSQYEQLYNTHVLNSMGIQSIKELNKKSKAIVENWLATETKVKIEYPDVTQDIIDALLSIRIGSQSVKTMPAFRPEYLVRG